MGLESDAQCVIYPLIDIASFPTPVPSTQTPQLYCIAYVRMTEATDPKLPPRAMEALYNSLPLHCSETSIALNQTNRPHNAYLRNR